MTKVAFHSVVQRRHYHLKRFLSDLFRFTYFTYLDCVETFIYTYILTLEVHHNLRVSFRVFVFT